MRPNPTVFTLQYTKLNL